MEPEQMEQETHAPQAEDRGDTLDFESEAAAEDEAPETEAQSEASDGQDDGAQALDEEENDAADADEETAGEAPKAIPQARFNEVNEKYKAERDARLALQEELARARGQTTPEEDKGAQDKPFDIEAAEERYLEAVLEGNRSEARELQKQIREHERAQLKAQLREETRLEREQAEQASEAARLQQTAKSLYQKYPQLDGSHKEADADLIETVLALRDRFIQQGAKPADALLRAADKTCGKFSAPAGAAPQAAEAKKPDVKRNLQREAQIPARGGGKGTRSQPLDLDNLSDAEFSKLSAEDIARARGDYL